MRIVAGRHRGRPLAVPAGRSVRPTSDRARQAVFDRLVHGLAGADGRAPFQDAHVLDAFAGTGALGLEALSRGAGFATFLENAGSARHVLRENIARLGETGRAAVLEADATRPPRPPAGRAPAALVFLDPPYGGKLAVPALAALAAAGWLAADALAVLETAAGDSPDCPEGWSELDRRRYGAASVLFLQRGAGGWRAT